MALGRDLLLAFWNHNIKQETSTLSDTRDFMLTNRVNKVRQGEKRGPGFQPQPQPYRHQGYRGHLQSLGLLMELGKTNVWLPG